MSKKSNNSGVQQIMQYVLDKEPSKIKDAVEKEIASRVMNSIETRRRKVGSALFGK